MSKNEINLESGLIGLPSLKRWTLLESDTDLPLMWLQSLDNEGFRLPVSDPALFCDSFKPNVPGNALKYFTDESDIVVLIVTTIPADGGIITGNLAAPLIISASRKTGAQIIQEDSKYSMRQPIDITSWHKSQAASETKIKVAESLGSEQTDEVVVCV
jgi:flagellar assembly factor FliW